MGTGGERYRLTGPVKADPCLGPATSAHSKVEISPFAPRGAVVDSLEPHRHQALPRVTVDPDDLFASVARTPLLRIHELEDRALQTRRVDVTKALGGEGAIVERADAPLTYDFLNRAFARLARREEAQADDYLALNELFLVDSPTENAVIHSSMSAGVRVIHSLAFLHFELLRTMIRYDPAWEQMPPDEVDQRLYDEVKSGLLRIVGVLAHELSHPRDDVDKLGIGKSYYRPAAQQALELRADADGTLLLRESGYPMDSIFGGLERSVEGGALHLASAAAESHPIKEVRLASLRLLMTLLRYEQGPGPGAEEFDVSLEDAKAIMGEIYTLRKRADQWAFRAPKDIHELVERLKAIPNTAGPNGEKSDYQSVEFNRLLLHMDEILERRETDGPPLELEEIAMLQTFFTSFARSTARYPDIATRRAIPKLMTAANGSAEFANVAAHPERKGKLQLFRSVAFDEWMRGQFLRPRGRHDGFYDFASRVNEETAALCLLFPEDRVFETMKERLADVLEMFLIADKPHIYPYRWLAEKFSPEFSIRMAHLLVERVWPSMTDAQKTLSILEMLNSEELVFPPRRMDPLSDERIVRSGSDVPNSARARLRPILFRGRASGGRANAGDEAASVLEAQYREVVRALWDDRGFYGTLSVIADLRIDWPFIFEVLGFDEEEAGGDLRKAIKAFAAGDRYPELLKGFREESFEALDPKQAGYTNQGIPWMDNTLYAHLSGERNPLITKDPELHEYARHSFGATALARSKNYGGIDENPGAFQRIYRSELKRCLGQGDREHLTTAELETFVGDLFDHLWTRNFDFPRCVGPPSIVLVAAENAHFIDRASLDPDTKRALLRFLFVDHHDEKSILYQDYPGDWLAQGRPEDQRSILEILKRNGVIRYPSELLDIWNAIPKRPVDLYATSMSALSQDLLEELDERFSDLSEMSPEQLVERQAEITRFSHLLGMNLRGHENSKPTTNSATVQGLKAKVVSIASELDLSHARRLAVFMSLTQSGPTKDTDTFFREHLRDELGLDDFEMFLGQARFAGGPLALELAKAVLEPEVEELIQFHGESIDRNLRIHRMVKALHEFVPKGSTAKDRYLDRLAWRLKLTGRELQGLIEDQKSSNWRRGNPMLVNAASGIATELVKLNPKERSRLIDELTGVKAEGVFRLPDAVCAALERLGHQAARAADISPAQRNSFAKRHASTAKAAIEQTINDASPFERIPLFEILIQAGDLSLARQGDYPMNVIRDHLGYAEDSDSAKMLEAFLAIIPEHERSVTLAYMLSQAGEDKGSVADIFEVFMTVGKKAGQLSSIYQIFGEDVARQCARLKDRGREMSKAEILAEIERTLSPEEKAKIRSYDDVGASASVKDGVWITLTDGRRAFLLVRRPGAEDQIRSNLTLGKAFLKELQANGLTPKSKMLATMITALEEQLSREIDMRNEGRNLPGVSRLFEGLNSDPSVRELLDGWKFHVPLPVEGFQIYENLIVLEGVDGVPYRVEDEPERPQLDEATRKALGPALVKSSLMMLFRFGQFEPDRHSRNWLFDENTKTIHVLDFGQLQEFQKGWPWEWDDALTIGSFLRALSEGDAHALTPFFLSMSGAHVPKSLDVADLEARFAIILGQKDTGLADKIIQLNAAASERDVSLEPKFAFGAFKGLMVLLGEHYVEPDEFERIVSEEISRMIVRKAPALMLDTARKAIFGKGSG